MTWWCAANVGQDRSEHLARAEPAVQQDHRPPAPVGLVVEVEAIDIGVLAGACGLGFPGGGHGCPPRFI